MIPRRTALGSPIQGSPIQNRRRSADQLRERRCAMARAFGLVLLLISLYIGMEIYTKGIEHTLGGAFAPIQPMSQRETPLARSCTLR